MAIQGDAVKKQKERPRISSEREATKSKAMIKLQRTCIEVAIRVSVNDSEQDMCLYRIQRAS